MVSKNRPNLLNCELKRISEVSQRTIQKLERFSYAIGVRLIRTQWYELPLKCWSTVIIILCFVVFIGEYNVVNTFKQEPFAVYAELTIGLLKNFYLLYQQKKLYEILHTAQSSSILCDLELFQLNILQKLNLSKEIGQILRQSWSNINSQITYIACTFFAAIIYYLMTPFARYFYEVYVLHNSDFSFPLPFEVYIPYWQWGHYEIPPFALRSIISLAQPYCCGFSTTIFVGAFIISTMHVVALLRVLRCLLHKVTDDTRVPEHLRVQYLCVCVKLHARISEYHTSIDNFFRYIILVQFGSSCVIICIVLYKASLGLESDSALLIKMSMYLAAVVLEISIFNIDAQKVTTESEQCHLDWYTACAWYNENRQFKFIIRMMLLKRTYSLGVGGFTQMSHSFLLQVMRMSGNFFLLLRKVNGNS